MTAAASLSTIVAVCFVAQALSLGKPRHSELIAVRTIASLVRYDGSRATIAINGQQHTTVCSQRWDRSGHVLTVAVAGHGILRKIGGDLETRGKLALDEFELAGCPRSLEEWLTTQLNDGKRMLVRPTRAYGHDVYELRARAATIGLALFVLRAQGRPVGLTISGGGLRGTSRLTYTVQPDGLPLWFHPDF